MNFFERILTGRLFFKKKNDEVIRETIQEEKAQPKMEVIPEQKAEEKKQEIKPEKKQEKPVKVTLPVEMPDTVVKFTFMDKTYILEAFELNFGQELNLKGQPGGLPRGGIMTITLSETPDYYINEWMLREELQRDGVIRILPNKGRIDEGAGLVISFRDAYCIRYNKKIDTGGAGVLTTIVVSPRAVKIGNEEFINRWKKQESLPYYIRSN